MKICVYCGKEIKPDEAWTEEPPGYYWHWSCHAKAVAEHLEKLRSGETKLSWDEWVRHIIKERRFPKIGVEEEVEKRIAKILLEEPKYKAVAVMLAKQFPNAWIEPGFPGLCLLFEEPKVNIYFRPKELVPESGKVFTGGRERVISEETFNEWKKIAEKHGLKLIGSTSEQWIQGTATTVSEGIDVVKRILDAVKEIKEKTGYEWGWW